MALAAPDYVGSDTCAGCHADQATDWAGSHHALAWTAPSADTVLGDFDDAVFAHDGMSVTFHRQGDGFGAQVTEKDGSIRDYPLHSVVGVAPLQQYLFETEPGRLQSFDVVWDTIAKHWYALYPDQDLPPGDGLHWTGPYKTWNARCAECHATGYVRNYGLRTGRYQSEQAEIGVGCEACHGPGSAHVDWIETGAALPAGLGPAGFPMTFSMDDRDGYVGQCAGCHSRREALGDGNPLPGTPFGDAYSLALLRPGLYHADGQIQDEVYVYGSFLQSKMYQKGVGCGNCHDPHSGAPLAEGNALCTQCHSPAGNPDFPSLRLSVYDDPAHHFHPQGSAGAQCRNCHMIERTYMGIDGRRDHSFRVPRPDLGARINAPDACTDCHGDRTQDWAAGEIRARFPDGRWQQAHYGDTLYAGRQDPLAAGEDLLALALDPTQPGIVRASAARMLHNVDLAGLADRSAALLQDPDPLVRAAAARLQAAAPPETRIRRLQPLLSDPLASVRIDTARALIDLSPQGLTASQGALLRAALGEWQRSLATRLDFPETHLVLGGLALQQRNLAAANAAFREAVALDPQRSEAWVMLVRLAAASQGAAAARTVLDEALRAVPDTPELQAYDRQLAR